jgi:hypothetical protein
VVSTIRLLERQRIGSSAQLKIVAKLIPGQFVRLAGAVDILSKAALNLYRSLCAKTSMRLKSSCTKVHLV